MKENNKTETYEMQATCGNCRTKFIVDIPKGERTSGQNCTCPYCGLCSCREFSFERPKKHSTLAILKGI